MPKPEIRPEVVERVAELARLGLTVDERQQLAIHLGQILGYVEQLSEVDVSGLAPLTHPQAVSDALRSDELGTSLSSEQALRNAPEHNGSCFLVPPVLG